MKKLAYSLISGLFAATLLAQPLSAAAVVVDRDVLLTADGTLYTVERVSVKDQENPDALPISSLQLKVRVGENSKNLPVPASLTGGVPSSPSLAFDAESKTLFIFWQKQPNRLSSELLLCSFSGGVWGPVTSIENSPFHLRSNLRIGVTRTLEQADREGVISKVPGVVLHAIWWDQYASGEAARYAMLSVEKGKVQSIEIRDLTEFASDASAKDEAGPVTPDLNREFLRHPAIFESPARDMVDVIFADWQKNRFHRVSIRPVIQDNGYIRLPVGRHRGAFDAPDKVAHSEAISVVAGAAPESVLFFKRTEKGLEYLMHSGEGWSEQKTFRLSDEFSAEAGVEVLKKMISSE